MRRPDKNNLSMSALRILAVAAFLAGLLSGCFQLLPTQPQPAPELVAAKADLMKHDVAKAKERFEAAINKDRANRFTYLYIMQYSLLASHPELVTEYFHRAESALTGIKGEK